MNRPSHERRENPRNFNVRDPFILLFAMISLLSISCHHNKTNLSYKNIRTVECTRNDAQMIYSGAAKSNGASLLSFSVAGRLGTIQGLHVGLRVSSTEKLLSLDGTMFRLEREGLATTVKE